MASIAPTTTPSSNGTLGANVFGPSPYTENPQLTTTRPGLTFGANASYVDAEQTASAVNPMTGATTTTRKGSTPTTKTGVDLAFHDGPFSFQAEGYARTRRAGGGLGPSVGRGGFLQAGLFVLPKTLELAARGDVVDLDVHGAGAPNVHIDGGTNWYVRGDHLKLQLRYAWDRAERATTHTALVSNLVTLQTQLAF